MRKYFGRFAAMALMAALMAVPCSAARTNADGELLIRVGLASSSSHNTSKELMSAHLMNSTGHGAGYRFGYYDEDFTFHQLGCTDDSVTQIAMLKTLNLYYGYSASLSKYTYTNEITGDIAVGCYHVRLPGEYASFEEASVAAAQYEDGFVAWISGVYQVRVGAYTNRGDAEKRIEELGQGEVKGTSSYGISIVETGTDRVLFQFDAGKGGRLAVLPDVTGAEDVHTWFQGYRYRGGFTYERVNGDNLTVVNVLELEDYIKGVAPYEMGRSWPLEALKTQATCARTYVLDHLNYHNSLGFDICNTHYCQVYNGVGSTSEEYSASATSDQAVEETAGQVVWYQDKLAETYYSSSHGGASESVALVWGSSLEKYPYLCGVSDPYEQTVADRNAKSSWTVEYSKSSLTQRLQKRGYGVGTTLDHMVLHYSALGNVIKIEVHWANGQSNSFKPDSIRSYFGVDSIRFTVNGAGVETVSETGPEHYLLNETQQVSGIDGMYVLSGTGTVSQITGTPYVITGNGTVEKVLPTQTDKVNGTIYPTNTTVTVKGDHFIFQGSGWGHQLGMSQYGANAMARLGFTYDQIITFYFPGTTVAPYQR